MGVVVDGWCICGFSLGMVCDGLCLEDYFEF